MLIQTNIQSNYYCKKMKKTKTGQDLQDKQGQKEESLSSQNRPQSLRSFPLKNNLPCRGSTHSIHIN